ncbi:MAG: helix-turn-helix domain-containing protein [Alphaproteobacteria bacterium]|nr:helix-turn-helix domain-containing protein [Alphaproteobacteria bacterium]
MSYSATNWAFQQKGLRPAQKVVLLYLADRHNPDYGCFPSQQRLAFDCEMSRASLNTQLRQLEERDLIRRIRSRDRHSGQHVRTHYILGFEDGFDQTPSPETGHGPCPDYAQNRVQNLDTNLVIEPVRLITRGQASARVRARDKSTDDPRADFLRRIIGLIDVDANTDEPRDGAVQFGTAADRAELDHWLGDLGLSEAGCLSVVAKVMAKAKKPPRSFRYFRSAIEDRATKGKRHKKASRRERWPTIRARLPKEIRAAEEVSNV